MIHKKYLLIAGLFLLTAHLAWSQTISAADSLSSEQVNRLREIAAWKSNWDIARSTAVYFLPILGFLLGGLFTYLGIKSRFQKWAEEQVTVKASEKLGLDWTILKSLVDGERHRLNTLQKRIAVINQSTGKRDDLVGLLTKSGFNEKKHSFLSPEQNDNL